MDLPGVGTIRGWLGCANFAVAPLITRSGMLGAIIADNAISGREISDLDMEFLQLFANQSASAIENSRLYTELERRLIALRKAHEKQKEDQDTLLRMERLSVMGETSAIVAHELRNPLVAIGGFARALVRNLDQEDPNHQYARIITEEVARMETIIHDLLDFIRPQKLMRKEVEIDRLVASSADRFAQEMQTKGIQLGFDLQAGQAVVSCNPGEIQQVLQNFLMNALQVMPDGGKVELRTRLLDGGVKVEVLDTGPGFAKDVADKLFSPFFTTKPTGSGLGLTICAQIIKSHGGVVGARNRAEKGAGFSFILPLPKE
jgi:signal transduction histidine kinase